eukprot:4398064-Amphidinium_carterae.1
MTEAPAPLSTFSFKTEELQELRSRLGLSTSNVFSLSALTCCGCCGCVAAAAPGAAEVQPTAVASPACSGHHCCCDHHHHHSSSLPCACAPSASKLFKARLGQSAA